MSIKTKKIKILQNECRICGAPAEYTHFGVISCTPCKMLFKRNTNTEKRAFVCNFNGQCEININNRHTCSSCRLAKCYKCGMSIDKLQESRYCKPKIKALVKVQGQQQPERVRLLNQTDRNKIIEDIFFSFLQCQSQSLRKFSRY
ncbi:unnamed protein product [Rotaria sp. Silwood1]|nr:unnamed protein product [Rotaria sp. Silwood1]CAF1648586.1 unnamed protein product [Rotaria sp. Silwood1]CAF4098963.1 unnamed protein product [Rotaria sp. Silwood1]